MKNRPISVLIDANPIVVNKSGIGQFTYRMLESLAKLPSSDLKITAYYFNFLGRKPTPELPGEGVIQYKVVRFLPTKVLAILHRLHLQLPLEFFLGLKKYDYMIFPNFVAVPSLRKTPYAVTVHDMGFVDCPEYISDGNRAYLERFVKRSVIGSSSVITISNFTKERIVDVYGTSPSDVLVLPIPYEKPDHSGPVSESIKSLSKKPFILYVGTIEPRKNLDGLLNAFALTSTQAREQTQIVFAGGMGWKTEKILSAIESTKDKIDLTLTGYISDADRDYLYQRAALVCIPSHYEGFGMQLLEAMYYQRKLLLSSIPVFHEVAGDYASYCDASDLKEFAKAIESALGASTKKAAKTQDWSWQKNAQELTKHIAEHTIDRR